MTPYFIVDGTSQDDNFHRTVEALRVCGYPFHIVTVIPFTSYIMPLSPLRDLDPSVPLVTLGDMDIARRLREAVFLGQLDPECSRDNGAILGRLKRSFFHTPHAFSQDTAREHGVPLLNQDAVYTTLGAFQPSEDPVFIKPRDDQKAFIGGILFPDERLQERFFYGDFQPDLPILVAPVRYPETEYRFMIVQDRIITGSQYKQGRNFHVDATIPPDVARAAEQLARHYQPASIFTMDLARMPDGSINVVEYNCWNASGHYACDMVAMYQAVAAYLCPSPEISFTP